MSNTKHVSMEEAENGFIVWFRNPGHVDDALFNQRTCVYQSRDEALEAVKTYFAE